MANSSIFGGANNDSSQLKNMSAYYEVNNNLKDKAY